MKKIVFWDLDGTLIDTLEDLGAAVNHALTLRDLPQLSSEDFRKMVGHGVRNLVSQALEKAAELGDVADGSADVAGRGWQAVASGGDGLALATVRTDAYIDAALADFKEYYCANIDVFTRPYPGMPELLSELSAAGVKMAVVSNKFQEGTEHLVKEFFPGVNFVAVLGNRPGWPLKPSPEIVEDVLRRCDSGSNGSSGGISRANAILVGDSPTDMRTAANGGIDAIAVAWGYSSPEELAEFLAHEPASAMPPGAPESAVPPGAPASAMPLGAPAGPVSRPRIARNVGDLRRMLLAE